MGIFHSENRDHYSWVTCRAQLQQPGEQWCFGEVDSLLSWRLAGKCWCLEWKAAIKQLSAVPLPALLRNVQLSCISNSLVAWLVWVCGWMRCRAPWCWYHSWFQSQQGCTQARQPCFPFFLSFPQLLAVAVWICSCCWWEGLRNETQQVVRLLPAAHLLSLAGTRKTVFKQNIKKN